MQSASKVWFITGASSGFGRAVAELALLKGDKVVATLRKPEILSELMNQYPETLLVVRLDVTQPTEITTAFSLSHEKFGRVDIVLNNAGYAAVSEVEGTHDKTARDLFEVNFWGASHVSREAVRFFREENKPMGGRLLQMSSLSGIVSSPGCVYYCATKFALEALSEGLAAELDPRWNIKVTILEPGPFRTNCPGINVVVDPVHPAYTDTALSSMQWRSVDVNAVFNGDPDKFAEIIYRTAYLEDPPLRLPVHKASLRSLRQKAKELLDAADEWETWSEDILL
ncbi:hypothetical protein F5I97DRAFT_1415692 [Phlebopus sp. FC_14]|nr:hypothetical protein F5I97DRAFT_671281 [Phlebopus sp. FC_14]KAH7885572.1 hypothetical protein F5I97DRAFT_1415692 [Phlebopus sp. FC_14]